MKTAEMNYKAAKNLGCAIALQMAKDFFDRPWEEEGIINMLKSSRMNLLTNGLSIKLAEKLVNNPDEVKENLGMEEEDNA
jgi:hypothetical protein